ncbi:MAG: PHP-associated domain-containing protein, partial [Halodesulfurarchaeum sp.]
DVRRAKEIARSLGLDVFGSSYAHVHRSIGEVWTEFDRRIDTETDLYDALRFGEPRRVYRRDGPGHTLCRSIEVSHLAWENSYQKLDRVLLSGLEPTHPHHIAYDGHFEDVAVY